MDEQEARMWTEEELQTFVRAEIKGEKAADPNKLVTLLGGKKVPQWVAMMELPTGDCVIYW